MKKKIENIIYGISALGIMWVLASWVDVILHNTTTFQYASWNLFKILFQEGKQHDKSNLHRNPKEQKRTAFRSKDIEGRGDRNQQPHNRRLQSKVYKSGRRVVKLFFFVQRPASGRPFPRAGRIYHYTTPQQFCQALFVRQIAQRSSRNFVQSDHCKMGCDVIYL